MINALPASVGHTLILPRDFAVYHFYDLAKDELREHHRFAKFLRAAFNKHFKPDGYNIGWNVGAVGGQSIAHAHMHILPRYEKVNTEFGIQPKGGIARMQFHERPSFYNSYNSSEDREFCEFLLNEAPPITENETAFAVQLTRTTAVNPGHTYIYSKTPRKNYFTCSEKEIMDQLDLALTVMNMQSIGERAPGGYNLGWDVGKAAGQIGNRCYLQLVPRYKGDSDNPRGGILKAIPDEAYPVQTDYYDQKNAGKDVKVETNIEFPFTYWTSSKKDNVLKLK